MSTVPRPDPGPVGCVRLFTLRRKSRVLLIRIHAHPRAKCPVLGLLVCMTASVQGEGSGFPLRRERRRVGRPFCVGVGVVARQRGLRIPVATRKTGVGRTFCVRVGVVARRQGLWIPVATRETGGGENIPRVGEGGCPPTWALDSRCAEKDGGWVVHSTCG